MITGSHNPGNYNGFKMVLGHGAFFGERIQELGRMAAAGDWETGSGSVRDEEVMDRYVERLLRGFDGGAFRIGWDCGNGAAGPVVERLVERLPGEHFTFFTEVDGRFPNHHPDPTVEANLEDLKRLVREKGLDFGVAFDGDADRLGAVDGEGRVVWGDQLLSILAEPVLRELPGATIIADVKASQALFDRVAELGGTPLMWKTGHSLIKSKMKETGAPLAGEMSGHIFFKHEWYGFDDAIYAAAPPDPRGQPARRIADRPALGHAADDQHARDALPGRREPQVPGRRGGARAARRRAAPRSTAPTAPGSAPPTAGGCCAPPTPRTSSSPGPRRKDEAGLERLIAQIDEQLALSGLERGEQVAH